MHFASLPPWWLTIVVALACAAAVFAAYRRPMAPLSTAQRAVLVALRTATFLAILLLLFRPVALRPPVGDREQVVPVLVDVSRSMRVPDAEGDTRIARAATVLRFDLLPALSRQYRVELLTAGDALEPASSDALGARANQSDLSGALLAVRERFRGQRVAGVVVLSDGGDTGLPGSPARAREAFPWPVFAIGVGAASGLRDREVLGIAAGDQRLEDASVDLQVSAVSHGFGREPFELRVLADGRLLDSRRVVPSADGSPIEQRLTVFPDSHQATVYTVEIPAAEGEPVVENNTRSVLVSPAGRKRRLLVIEGAPGFEHTFVRRAWAADSGLEVDSVVRKGTNVSGSDTFLIQADAARAPTLTAGFPARREDLYAYDAVVISNVEGRHFTREQLAMVADFVSERGGGLLVAGGRSFAQRGLVGTPVEAVLPVELDERRGGPGGPGRTSGAAVPPNGLVLTAEGETHPIMRLGASGEETQRRWAALPPLASTAPLGGSRPGAVVLAVAAAGGVAFPVVAVQRYGQGRSMVFGGEASWRWRMMMSSADRSHELFWRQAARWLAGASPDPVAIALPDAPQPGDTVAIDVDARDAAFSPVADASVEATVERPGGDRQPLTFRRVPAQSGRFTSAFRPDRAGVYRVRAEARRGRTSLGASERWIYVGGGDREFADPRLNEGFLRRAARDSGGRYVRAADASRLVNWLEEAARQNAGPVPYDLWHEPWTIAALVMLLSTEWVLRRTWGLR